jgi:hypothetical protein
MNPCLIPYIARLLLLSYVGFCISVNRKSYVQLRSTWRPNLLLRGGEAILSPRRCTNVSGESQEHAIQPQPRHLTLAENLLLFPKFPTNVLPNGEPICGMGLGVSSENQFWNVCFITPDSAADRSGKIRVGDRLVAINGRSLEGLSEDQVRALALGKAGTRVTLQIAPDKGEADDERQLHPSSDSFVVEFEREPSFLPPWAQEDPEQPIPREDGAAKWRYVAEQTDIWKSMGYNLSEFGCWEERVDALTRRVFYVDLLTNRTRSDKPVGVLRWEQMEKLTPTQQAEETYRAAASFLNRYSLLPRNESEPWEPLPPLDSSPPPHAAAPPAAAQSRLLAFPPAAAQTLLPASRPPLAGAKAEEVEPERAGGEGDQGNGDEEFDEAQLARDLRAALRADWAELGVDLAAAEPEMERLRGELAALYPGDELREGVTAEERQAALTGPLTPAEEAFFAAHPDLIRRLSIPDEPPAPAPGTSSPALPALAGSDAPWEARVETEGVVTADAVALGLDRAMAQVRQGGWSGSDDGGCWEGCR